MQPLKADLVRRAVGRGHGVKQRIRHGGDAQHAPAAGDEHIVRKGRARVVHGGPAARQLAVREARDGLSFFIVLRVSA